MGGRPGPRLDGQRAVGEIFAAHPDGDERDYEGEHAGTRADGEGGRHSGRQGVIVDRAAGGAIAAPTPCRTRAVISSHECVAKPPSSDARVKTRIPALNIRRRPRMSPDRPPSISSPPKVTA